MQVLQRNFPRIAKIIPPDYKIMSTAKVMITVNFDFSRQFTV